MRRKIIAANWKMNKNINESIDFANKLAKNLSELNDRDVIICPPFVNLQAIKSIIEKTPIKIGAQNIHFEKNGAFTGEISADMLKSIACDYVIVGHSERRTLFGEDDRMINLKIKTVFENGMIPIFCIGETLEERESGILLAVVERQLKVGLAGISGSFIEKIVIAYEPVWAIGTGKVASNEQAQEMHRFIRDTIVKMYNNEFANSIRIQYGGSVKPDNVSGLMAESDIDGALVGGASLDPESFTRIVLYDR